MNVWVTRENGEERDEMGQQRDILSRVVGNDYAISKFEQRVIIQGESVPW